MSPNVRKRVSAEHANLRASLLRLKQICETSAPRTASHKCRGSLGLCQTLTAAAAVSVCEGACEARVPPVGGARGGPVAARQRGRA